MQPDDPMDALLQLPVQVDSFEPMREQVYQQTVEILLHQQRRRKQWRLLRRGSAVAGTLLLIWFVLPKAKYQQVTEVVVAPRKVVPTATVIKEFRTPADVELAAELAETTATAAALYRLAGDRYLAEQQKYDHAFRCYSSYLELIDKSQLQIDPKDNWLLSQLKSNFLKQEQFHAAKNSW